MHPDFHAAYLDEATRLAQRNTGDRRGLTQSCLPRHNSGRCRPLSGSAVTAAAPDTCDSSSTSPKTDWSAHSLHHSPARASRFSPPGSRDPGFYPRSASVLPLELSPSNSACVAGKTKSHFQSRLHNLIFTDEDGTRAHYCRTQGTSGTHRRRERRPACRVHPNMVHGEKMAARKTGRVLSRRPDG